MSFRCAGAVFCEGPCLRCKSIVIRVSGVVVLMCFAWNARASIFSSVIFVGPVVQSARFHNFRFERNRSKSFWRYSPVLVFRMRRESVKFRFRGRRSILSRCNVIFRDRRSALKLFVQISWQAQYFRACVQISWQAHHCGWVKSLSLWRGAHFEIARRTLCALWVGQIALAVARCTFGGGKVKPLRALSGSNRSRCGAVHMLGAQSEPSDKRCGKRRARIVTREVTRDGTANITRDV